MLRIPIETTGRSATDADTHRLIGRCTNMGMNRFVGRAFGNSGGDCDDRDG